MVVFSLFNHILGGIICQSDCLQDLLNMVSFIENELHTYIFLNLYAHRSVGQRIFLHSKNVGKISNLDLW